jgi:hypothetical protein
VFPTAKLKRPSMGRNPRTPRANRCCDFVGNRLLGPGLPEWPIFSSERRIPGHAKEYWVDSGRLADLVGGVGERGCAEVGAQLGAELGVNVGPGVACEKVNYPTPARFLTRNGPGGNHYLGAYTATDTRRTLVFPGLRRISDGVLRTIDNGHSTLPGSIATPIAS